ncbi:MAG: signal recognition particle-docking protein FtsY, partial [Nanoarchaeota archaeon]
KDLEHPKNETNNEETISEHTKKEEHEHTKKEVRKEETVSKPEHPHKEEPKEKFKEEVDEDKGFFQKIFQKRGEKLIEEEKKIEKLDEKEGVFEKLRQVVATKKLSENKFDDIFWEIEMALMENNVAVEVIDKIKADLKKNLVEVPIKKDDFDNAIINSLDESIREVLSIKSIDLIEEAKRKKPLVICFLGINGSGKTTTVGKIAKMFQNNNMSVVMAAADTFRAAAIEQLEKHANNLGVKMIKHDYGSDAAAVAFDAIEHAKAKNKDVVLIDTAGRLHSNKDLLDELKKVIKVSKPDLKIFVGESITGNDCVEQAKEFNDSVGIDGIILAKADVDEKGGAALSVSYVTKKPILYFGTGQGYDDLEKFDMDKIMKSLGL